MLAQDPNRRRAKAGSLADLALSLKDHLENCLECRLDLARLELGLSRARSLARALLLALAQKSHFLPEQLDFAGSLLVAAQSDRLARRRPDLRR